MMLMLFITNMILSIVFLFMIHPLSMGMILLIQTMIVSLITGFLNFNYWFSYILFLIMIGGMLVLFIYMTSVASNEKFKNNNKLMIFIIISILIMLILMLKSDSFFIMNSNFNKFIFMNYNYYILSKFYNAPSNYIMFLMIIYLFITLIAIVKITNFQLGPLRQKF
uniref:NADH-ubiquinone oxidoreductase chain 6 n=1 Tax=Ochthebius uniformis TaxID=1309380 RepID=A0A7H0DKU8_9COLE|nr:NADH dehydrogenase subunit 6 [Ochthebius uniformis]QNP09958.1 NADH dehydrogenase subunit 6 [Ochthebius uniformis]